MSKEALELTHLGVLQNLTVHLLRLPRNRRECSSSTTLLLSAHEAFSDVELLIIILDRYCNAA